MQESDCKQLVTVSLDARLREACIRMSQRRIHRIVVIDKSSNMVVGVMDYKDILLLLIRNLTDDEHQHGQVYDIPVEYFFADRGSYFPELRRISSQCSTYECFYRMVHEDQISSLPVVNESDIFIGMVYIRDIAFVWRTQNFEIVRAVCGGFAETERKRERAGDIFVQ